MTAITLSTDNLQAVHLFEELASVLNVSFEKTEEDEVSSKSMQQALRKENDGSVTKLVSHKNAVAEIFG